MVRSAKQRLEAEEDVTSLLPRKLDVVIEVPRGSFLKRGSTGRLDFISPLPSPFNYGSVESLIGLEGDLLDAVVLGPRQPRGTRLSVTAYGAIGMTDRGMYDDKLICSNRPLRRWERSAVLVFFAFYAKAKWLLNRVRGQSGRNASEGWVDADLAIARAKPRKGSGWKGPTVPF